MLRLTTDKFHYDKDSLTFSQEASSLRLQPGRVYQQINLVNTSTKRFLVFSLKKTMMDDSGEDVGGWMYQANLNNKLIELYVWND